MAKIRALQSPLHMSLLDEMVLITYLMSPLFQGSPTEVRKGIIEEEYGWDAPHTIAIVFDCYQLIFMHDPDPDLDSDSDSEYEEPITDALHYYKYYFHAKPKQADTRR
jgi:hypothetical protein